MRKYLPQEIRNIALLGHASSGKTTLADAILYSVGLTDRIGSTADGSTVMDYDAEEKKRGASLQTSVYGFEYDNKKINLIDAPGLFDFSAGVSEALTAADCALLALSGKSGLTVGAQLNYKSALECGIPCAFFVGKLDASRAYFYRVLSTLTAHYGAVICPVVVPYSVGDQVECFVDLIADKAYKCEGIKMTEVDMPQSEEIENVRSVMLEAVASTDDALMEKYFEGESFSPDEILSALKKGMLVGEICPVFSGINQTGEAVPLMLNILTKIAPSADERDIKIKKGDTEGKINANETSPASVVVFKTLADPFVGKLSYFKVITGTVKTDMKLINSRTGTEEKLGKLLVIKGGKQEETSELCAGDIGAAAKLGVSKTGDTLCAPGVEESVVTAQFQKPCLSLAIKPVKKGEEEKIASSLMRLMEEDPTIKYYQNNETREAVLSGLGEQHLDVIAARLKTKFGVEVTLSPAKVAYRETIRKKVKVQGRHKKQSGGHGQFGDVWIEFEPCDSEGLVFEEKIFGGAVPKNFFPAVEKGLLDSMQKGVLAGYPVVGVKATLVDGSYHPVDSSEMSFKLAAQIAFKDGISLASPVLLEPIGSLSVTVPDDVMGDCIGDINKRRGRTLGMEPAGERMQNIIAEVPMSEMSDFAVAMRSIAQGRATFDFEFARYEEAPQNIAEKIISENK